MFFKSKNGITLVALIVTIIVLLILAGISINMIAGDNSILKRAVEAKVQTAISQKKEEVQNAVVEELNRRKGNMTKVKISKVVERIKENYKKQEDKDAISGEETGDEENVFPGIIIYNQPASRIDDSIIIEVNADGSVGEVKLGKDSDSAEEGITYPTGSASVYSKVGGVYCNSPDLSGFNANCTFYVTYDNEGTKLTENIPISQPPPNEWYDYAIKKWANVVTINNGNKTYWTWIPRYKYTVDSTNKTTTARFVDMSDVCYMDVDNVKTQIDVSSFNISDAFTFNDKPLAGYWVSKYRVQEGTNDGTASASARTTNQISVDLSGFNKEKTFYVTYDDSGNKTSEDTPISSKAPKGWYDYTKKKWANIMTNNNGLKTYWTYIPRYKYQIWKELKITNIRYIKPKVTQENVGEDFAVPDSFTFNGKELKGYWVSKYRVQAGTEDGTAASSPRTVDQIEVDLSGFNKSKTFYVTYDDTGTKTSENIPISNSPPEGWYDYTKKKWANVVTDNNNLKTYWTYIPRYKYQIWKELKQTNIRFIKPSVTQNNAGTGFSVPDSFTFKDNNNNDVQLKGYWVSKYRVQYGAPNSEEFDGKYYK